MSDEIRLSPFLPQSVSELLPKSDKDFQASFVAYGPILVEALAKGENIFDAARLAGLATDDAVKLLATPEFVRYVEAYLSIGDVADKSTRIRIAKSILAAQIADGVTYKKREPMDILEYIRRESDTKRGEVGVYVQINNTSVPRPYINAKEIKQITNGE